MSEVGVSGSQGRRLDVEGACRGRACRMVARGSAIVSLGRCCRSGVAIRVAVVIRMSSDVAPVWLGRVYSTTVGSVGMREYISGAGSCCLGVMGGARGRLAE